MSYTTLGDAIEAAGFGVHETIADGQLHRGHIPGDSYGSLNLWYYDNGYSGTFCNWKDRIKHHWRNGSITHADMKVYRERIEADRKAREVEQVVSHRQAAATARRLWNQAIPLEGNRELIHVYPYEKNINPYEVRLLDDVLLVPMFYRNEMVSLQRIFYVGQAPDRKNTKRFLRGGITKDCYMTIGRNRDKVFICEGYATGCSLYEQTGTSVVVAFNAGNLKGVAIQMRELLPDAEIVIAADNDRDNEVNIGLVKGEAAAARIGASYIYPEFPDDVKGTDFNDYINAGGVV